MSSPGCPDCEYELVQPFDIDDGSLDDVDPKLAFCFGFEWHRFYVSLKHDCALIHHVHADNAARLVKLAERHGRKATVRWLNDDWKTIRVAAKEG